MSRVVRLAAVRRARTHRGSAKARIVHWARSLPDDTAGLPKFVEAELDRLTKKVDDPDDPPPPPRLGA